MQLLTLLPLGILLPILFPLYSYLNTTWLPAQYIFSPSTLQRLSQQSIALHPSNTTLLLHDLTSRLIAEYGPEVFAVGPNWTSHEWFFNNAGGAMGAMIILHASVSEYLIFFGTALQTEGHSGVHMADDYFTILMGEQRAAGAGELDARVYKPGMQHHLRRGDSIQYSMPEACFALELAQGWIPAMLPFGFMDTFSSTLDWWNLWKTVKLTGVAMVEQVLRGKF